MVCETEEAEAYPKEACGKRGAQRNLTPPQSPSPYQLIFFILVEEHTMILPKLLLHLTVLFPALDVFAGEVTQCQAQLWA